MSYLYRLISAHQNLKSQGLPWLIFDSQKWNQFLETAQGNQSLWQVQGVLG